MWYSNLANDFNDDDDDDPDASWGSSDSGSSLQTSDRFLNDLNSVLTKYWPYSFWKQLTS